MVVYLSYDYFACEKKQFLCLLVFHNIQNNFYIPLGGSAVNLAGPVTPRGLLLTCLLRTTTDKHKKIVSWKKKKQRILSLFKRIQSAMIWRLKNSLWHLSLQHQRDICSITAQSVSRKLVHNFITFPFCLPQSPPVILSFISLVFLPYLKPKPTVDHLKTICHDLLP